MASVKELVEMDARRADMVSCRVVRLFQDNTFWRAYDWSAWLLVKFFPSLKITKRQYKNIDDTTVFVGFPITSLQKFTPEGASVQAIDDKTVAVTLPENLFPEDADIAALQEDYKNWKQGVPASDNSKKEYDGEKSVVVEGHPIRLTDIMRKIMKFPIEQKSFIECTNFLIEVKKDLIEIIG